MIFESQHSVKASDFKSWLVAIFSRQIAAIYQRRCARSTSLINRAAVSLTNKLHVSLSPPLSPPLSLSFHFQQKVEADQKSYIGLFLSLTFQFCLSLLSGQFCLSCYWVLQTRTVSGRTSWPPLFINRLLRSAWEKALPGPRLSRILTQLWASFYY